MSPMTIPQQIITIAICVLGTMLTRFLPFLIFSSKKPTPKYIVYLGKALPCAVFGMLVVYCLKNVSILTGTHGLPELLAIAVTAGLHLWKKNMLLSIAGGTIVYMLLVQVSYFDKDGRFFLLTYFGCRSTFSLSDILHLS